MEKIKPLADDDWFGKYCEADKKLAVTEQVTIPQLRAMMYILVSITFDLGLALGWLAGHYWR